MEITKEDLPKNTVRFTITVPQAEVTTLRDHVLAELAKDTAVAGFRKGHAPKEIVGHQATPENLYGEMLNHAASEALAKIHEQYHPAVIAQPRLQIDKFEADTAAKFFIELATKPEVVIDNWRTEVSGVKTKEESLDKIVLAAKIEISDLAIEEETNRTLGRLLSQIEKLGITIDAYATSQGKTVSQIRDDYKGHAEKSLKLSFILDKLAEMEKIAVTDAEVVSAINAAPEPATREAALKNEEQKWYIKEVLKRNKVVDLVYGSISANSN